MIIRDPKVLVVHAGNVAVCTREGKPLFGARAPSTLDAIRKLRRLADALLEEQSELAASRHPDQAPDPPA